MLMQWCTCARHVQIMGSALGKMHDEIAPVIDFSHPYLSDLDNLPAHGWFLPVSDHTQFVNGEVLLISRFVRSEISVQVAAGIWPQPDGRRRQCCRHPGDHARG
ncbi:hypothetical protein [Mycobacterium uberis]|uniref:hypothetical protein n=1 Tax=Mycobacterium uberis TaxID=2162698 RepID=UPI001FB330DD|nr:hypothetical protein [Mycobacterium uberis]